MNLDLFHKPVRTRSSGISEEQPLAPLYFSTLSFILHNFLFPLSLLNGNMNLKRRTMCSASRVEYMCRKQTWAKVIGNIVLLKQRIVFESLNCESGDLGSFQVFISWHSWLCYLIWVTIKTCLKRQHHLTCLFYRIFVWCKWEDTENKTIKKL